jgi:ATP-dependent DNA helicase PIF1
MASLLEEPSFILWDEAPMTSRYCFEALDRTLRDVPSCNDATKSSLPYGGKTVIFGGDFRQILPVIEGGSRNEIIDASLTASPLWRHVTVLSLKENMCLNRLGLSCADREELTIFSQ